MKVIITDFPTNQKINAIKALRLTTGWGLKESKETIDNVPMTVNLDFNQIEYLRKQGLQIEAEYPYRLPLDKLQLMRDLVMTLIDEGQFKSAQYIIDAMEVLDE
jgi:capsule polysaccharide export protein KpsC/LpsZ